MAVFELLWADDVPDAVVIDEAVELAKTLSTDDSPAFVNGVLGAILAAEVPTTRSRGAGVAPSGARSGFAAQGAIGTTTRTARGGRHAGRGVSAERDSAQCTSRRANSTRRCR